MKKKQTKNKSWNGLPSKTFSSQTDDEWAWGKRLIYTTHGVGFYNPATTRATTTVCSCWDWMRLPRGKTDHMYTGRWGKRVQQEQTFPLLSFSLSLFLSLFLSVCVYLCFPPSVTQFTKSFILASLLKQFNIILLYERTREPTTVQITAYLFSHYEPYIPVCKYPFFQVNPYPNLFLLSTCLLNCDKNE